jgi:hypothetical protein
VPHTSTVGKPTTMASRSFSITTRLPASLLGTWSRPCCHRPLRLHHWERGGGGDDTFSHAQEKEPKPGNMEGGAGHRAKGDLVGQL